MAYIEAKNCWKIYGQGDLEVVANQDLSFEMEEGELVVILGASGAGKSTLLNILGGMDQASRGQLLIDGQDIIQYSERERIRYRREDVGFVFQFYNLVGNLTALENVELATELVSNPLDAQRTLMSVGLEGRQHHFPAQLSGGEQQRVAIARALAKNPKLLLCDEPTGALDYQTGKQILTLLSHLARKEGRTVIIVTHNTALAQIADRVIHMQDAQIKRIQIQETPLAVGELEY
ncbi:MULTISPECIES: ABC transporter ATP-binding protein [unclassified Streptococcus]|uniref:ABC transporter ATP-binding protein n=1 Tax=unclassified Streptococcus TaxID=2608887 RepID=UPI001071D81F|nr:MULTISPECIES: ABC transporter ATP-binding protein [unclassified Streptococcus]MBF0806326.1 ABC transporter ATP-binding protein [Streptococcus sp. 19428wA2_WM07]TFU28050.1 ABC transporter ATP-binding protein [Streptococcus sp. WM07]